MPTLDDLVAAGSSGRCKQELHQALLDILKGNPDILNSVTTRQVTDRDEVPTRSGSESDRTQRSPSSSFPELENSLNHKPREGYQWQLSDSDDGIDSAWTAATKNMTPREICRWRRKLFSIYVGHLPCDITKKELVQLFSEVGSVQDVHVQPAKEGGYTYGFIRYCTLDECTDAVSMLHGRLLGNRTITVEYAAETKDRLRGDDPSDLPLDNKDKLLRGDYPKTEHLYRPMSEGESQERMVLWKLRSSVARHMSSPGEGIARGVDAAGQENKELLMIKIQEIVKKVASLPADTFAVPSGSEGSPCSSWILKEMNRSHVSDELGQQNLARYPDRGQIECKDELSTSASEVHDMPPKETEHSPPLVSSKSQQNFVQDEGHAKTQEASSSPPNTQRTGHSSLETSLSPVASSSPGREERSQSELETTASDSFSLSSLSPERPLRQLCRFCQESPTRGHAAESSQFETSSSSSQRLPGSPCRFHHVEEPVEGDRYDQHEEGGGSGQHWQQTSPQDVTIREEGNGGPSFGQQFRGMGLCSFDSSDEFLINNNDILKKDQKQVEQCVSEVPQIKQAPIPTQYTHQEPSYGAYYNRAFGQQGLSDLFEVKNTRIPQGSQKEVSYASGITVPKQASQQIQCSNNDPMYGSNASSRPMGQPAVFGNAAQRTNTESIKRQTQYSPGASQMTQSSMPLQYGPRSVTNQANTPYHGLSDSHHVRNTGQHVEGQGQTWYSIHNTRPSQYNNPGSVNVSNEGNRSPTHQGLTSTLPYVKNTDSAMEVPKHYPSRVSHPKEQPMPSQTQHYNQETRSFSHQGNSSSAQPAMLSDSPYGKKADLPIGVQKPALYYTETAQQKQQTMPGECNSQALKHFSPQGNSSSTQPILSDSPYGKKAGLPVDGQKKVQYPSDSSQPEHDTMPSPPIYQPKHFSYQGNRASVQQRLSDDPPIHKNSGVPVDVNQPVQYLAEAPRLKERSPLSQYTTANQANQPLDVQNPSVVPRPKEDSLPSHYSSHGGNQGKQQPKEHSPPNQCTGHVTSQANQPFVQQGLFGDAASLLRYPPHLQAVIANMVAPGWQHGGLPRHPFLPPAVINPGIFQGWNGNPLLQQQLLASRLPFGSPFHAGGHQTLPRMGFGGRGTVPRPGQGCRVPLVGTQDHVVRGRTFAPRFPCPRVQNISTDSDSKKFVSGVSSVESLEMNDDKAHQSTGSDSRQSSMKSLTTSSESANLESPSKESEEAKSVVAGDVENNNVMRSAADSPSQDCVSRELPGVQSSPNGSCKERNTKLSATPSPEKAELKRIQRENDRLRQCIDWNRSGAANDGALTEERRETLKALIHSKEVQLQKEKEMIMARKAEQELLYEREKLEAAFDQQLQRELEIERKTKEANSKIRLAKLSNELLKLYVKLNGTKELKEDDGQV